MVPPGHEAPHRREQLGPRGRRQRRCRLGFFTIRPRVRIGLARAELQLADFAQRGLYHGLHGFMRRCVRLSGHSRRKGRRVGAQALRQGLVLFGIMVVRGPMRHDRLGVPGKGESRRLGGQLLGVVLGRLQPSRGVLWPKPAHGVLWCCLFDFPALRRSGGGSGLLELCGFHGLGGLRMLRRRRLSDDLAQQAPGHRVKGRRRVVGGIRVLLRLSSQLNRVPRRRGCGGSRGSRGNSSRVQKRAWHGPTELARRDELWQHAAARRGRSLPQKHVRRWLAKLHPRRSPQAGRRRIGRGGSRVLPETAAELCQVQLVISILVEPVEVDEDSVEIEPLPPGECLDLPLLDSA
mmetsp:Transcript_108352/g.305524  ORF Transcript_108352/g.305524 Transcript_108352/m.305524 type:complete len:349 (-) Transcript_108352:313-1359(-)